MSKDFRGAKYMLVNTEQISYACSVQSKQCSKNCIEVD